MDTKLKKSKPWTAWLSFFMAINILGLLFVGSLGAVAYSRGSLESLKSPFQDYKSSQLFKERTGNYFGALLGLVASSDAQNTGEQQGTKNWLNEEGGNLIYWAANEDTGLVVQSENEVPVLLASDAKPILPTGYNYCWYFDGEKVRIFDNGKQTDTMRLDSGYRDVIPNIRIYTNDPSELSNSYIVLAVKDDLQANPYGQSMYYWEQALLSAFGWVCIVLGILGAALLIYAIIRRQDKRRFDRTLASWSGSMWLEVKLLISLLFINLLGFVSFKTSGSLSDFFNMIVTMTVIGVTLLMSFWWLYLLIIDLLNNRRAFFSHNIINSIIKGYLQYEQKYPWQRKMLKRAYSLVIAEVILAFTAVFLILATGGGAFLIALLITAAGVYLIYRYLHRYNQTIVDLGALIGQIELVKNGNMETRLELAESADMYNAAQNLNSIQEGMGRAVADSLKSERMKIDLITNVSHDLKTPLTSIISYVDLLSQEKDLPEHVNDYIAILGQKSERLKNLIQDLFDLSKASSENIAMDVETIDLARLIKQTLADMDEQITDSGLAFRVNIPEEPIYILSDGKKLYRVWENLIANALKYSLAGSRVFIDLAVNENGALAAIKNTANYEMNFSEDEILQRFVRGDESRSTEGSGLGLSIAQSFTQLCGGQFNIKIDGDLFKVELRFKSV